MIKYYQINHGCYLQLLKKIKNKNLRKEQTCYFKFNFICFLKKNINKDYPLVKKSIFEETKEFYFPNW